jgi:hypothetical protein
VEASTFLQPYGHPRPVTGIALLFSFTLHIRRKYEEVELENAQTKVKEPYQTRNEFESSGLRRRVVR